MSDYAKPLFEIQRKQKDWSPSTEMWTIYNELEEGLHEDFDELSDLATACPDFPQIAKSRQHNIFIYNNFKENFKKSNVLDGHKCFGVGFTKSHFVMYRTPAAKSQMPVILYSSMQSQKRAPIYGELYTVPPEKIAELDWMESNGPLTMRVKLPIDAIVDAAGVQRQIYAWVYIHKQSYWETRMDRLRPVDLLTANSNKATYYNFMRKYEQGFN